MIFGLSLCSNLGLTLANAFGVLGYSFKLNQYPQVRIP